MPPLLKTRCAIPQPLLRERAVEPEIHFQVFKARAVLVRIVLLNQSHVVFHVFISAHFKRPDFLGEKWVVRQNQTSYERAPSDHQKD